MAAMGTTAGGGSGGGTAPSGGGAFPPAIAAASSWPHQGHRLWACMPDAFWVYVFKVHRCPHSRNHDWTLCPFAHWGERARRRDLRSHQYLPVSCPNYRFSHEYNLMRHTGEAPTCVRGATCRFAHGVFETWLHPERFRTRMCDAGVWCRRKVCFFAHHPAQLRREDDVVLPLADMEMLPPALLRPPRPLPPPRHRSVAAPRAARLFPRPGMMLQTRSGQRIPLLLHGGDDGASPPYSSPYTAAAAAVADPPAASSSRRPADEDPDDDLARLGFILDNGSSSVGGSSSSRRPADEDPDDDLSRLGLIPDENGSNPVGGGGGSSSRRPADDEDPDGFPDLRSILEMLGLD